MLIHKPVCLTSTSRKAIRYGYASIKVMQQALMQISTRANMIIEAGQRKILSLSQEISLS
jgi:hypothetical protein